MPSGLGGVGRPVSSLADGRVTGGLQPCPPPHPGETRICTKYKWKIHWVFTAVYVTSLLPRQRALESWRRDGISTFLGGQPGGARGWTDRLLAGEVSVAQAGTSQMWPARPPRRPWGRRLWSLRQSASFQRAAWLGTLRLSDPWPPGICCGCVRGRSKPSRGNRGLVLLFVITRGRGRPWSPARGTFLVCPPLLSLAKPHQPCALQPIR